MAQLFFKLVIGHFLCDYPLQGDFLAKAKNHNQPIPGVPWYQALIAHSVIQGGMVWLVTGSWVWGGVEFGMHAMTDVLKSEGVISFNQDQAAHIVCKLIYALLITSIGGY